MVSANMPTSGRIAVLRWAWGLLLCALAAAVAREGLSHISADNLYGYCFLSDLLTPGTRMAWSLPHSPYFFPDLLLVLPGVLLDAGIATTYHVAFVLHLGLLWGSIACLCRTANRETSWERHADVATRSVALYLASLLLYSHFDPAPAYFPTMHGNALPAGLLLVSLSIKVLYSEHYRIPTLLLLLLGTLVFLSDEIILAQFGAPLVAAGFIYSMAGLARWRRAALLAGLIVVAALLGRAVYGMLGSWPELLLKRAYIGISARGIGVLVMALVRQSPNLLSDGSVALVAAGMWVAGLTASVMRDRRNKRTTLDTRLAWCCGVLFMVIPCTLAATLGGLLVVQYEAVPQRYLLPLFSVPFVGLAIVETTPGASVRLRRLAQGLLLAIAALGLVRTAREPGSLVTPYPQWVQEVDRVAGQYGLRRGFACYDRAKPLAALSRTGLHVSALRGELPYVWIDNSYGYLVCDGKMPRLVPYDFILTEGLNRNRLRMLYGRPAAIERTSVGVEIWIYDPATGRPMNMSHFVGSLHSAANDYGYPLEFELAPAFLRLEGEDLAGLAKDSSLDGEFSGNGVGRLESGTALVTPWQRVPEGTQTATARIVAMGSTNVIFGLGHSADKLLRATRMEGHDRARPTDLRVRLDTDGLSDLRLVVRNDGRGPVFVDYLELRTEIRD